MPEGVIVGGWDFVAAAYLVTVIGLGGYGIGLWRRLRSASSEGVAAGSEDQP